MRTKKRMLAITLMLALILAGCGQETDKTSSSETAPNRELAVHESESDAQSELTENGDGRGRNYCRISHRSACSGK